MVTPPSINFHIPVDEQAISPAHEIPVETATFVTEAPVRVVQKGKKPRAKRKSSRTARKRSSNRKKNLPVRPYAFVFKVRHATLYAGTAPCP